MFILNFKNKMNLEQKIAFTLAEVLITLGIIGIVAAMTIPTLVANYQKHEAIVGYKKIYSTLTNAIKMSEAENGNIDDWDWNFVAYDYSNTNLTWIKTYLLPYLKISRACGSSSDGDCFSRNIKTANNNAAAYIPNVDSHFLKYVLADGCQIAVIFREDEIIEIVADINGLKKPNKFGNDIFDFLLVNKNASGYPMYGTIIKYGGLYPTGFGLKDLTNQDLGCNRSNSGSTSSMVGIYCGIKIIQDGYSIKDDYMW